VVPCFNEAATVGSVVAGIHKILPTTLVVNDGSTDNTAEIAQLVGAEVITHERNRGKGVAVRTGLNRAREWGFAWAILLDGDAQHAPEDIPAFLNCAEKSGAALIIGNRMADCSAMPLPRKLANRLSSWLISRLARQSVPDTQCGFRMVRLDAWAALKLPATGYEVEAEMLLTFAAAGHKIEFVPVRTIYGDEHSKFHPVTDTWRWLGWWRRQGLEYPKPKIPNPK
jgi:glycosyltransferase involved in cell wall biosynthesis